MTQITRTEENNDSDETDKLIDAFGGLIEGGAVWAGNKIFDSVFPEFNPKDNEEAKKKLKEKLQQLSAAAQDPEVKELIIDTSAAFAELTGDLLKAIEPPLRDIGTVAADVVIDAAKGAASTVAKTGIGVTEAALGEIPVVGGVVDLLLVGGSFFNSMAKGFGGAVGNIEKVMNVMEKLGVAVTEPLNAAAEKVQKVRREAGRIQTRMAASAAAVESAKKIRPPSLHTSGVIPLPVSGLKGLRVEKPLQAAKGPVPTKTKTPPF